MITIPKLKAEIAKCPSCETVKELSGGRACYYHEFGVDILKSLSQAIDEDVAKCEKDVFDNGSFIGPCWMLEPEQKCDTCKGKLWVKRLIEGERLEG